MDRASVGAPEAAVEEGPKPSSAAPALQTMLEPLQSLNDKGSDIGLHAEAMTSGNGELTPSDMVTLTMEAHEFLFRAEITANVANRSSDGIQQLFRQQS